MVRRLKETGNSWTVPRHGPDFAYPGVERQMTAEPSQPNFESLYHRAFAEVKLRALWNVRELEHPTPEEALIITRSLRVEGDLNARRLAEQLERACRATL